MQYQLSLLKEIFILEFFVNWQLIAKTYTIHIV